MEKPKTNTAVPAKPAAPKTLKIPRTFEIMIEEMHEEDDGSIRWRPVMVDPRLGGNGQVTLTVTSQQELNERQELYKSAGQRFKIIREINPPTRADIERMAAEQGITLPKPRQPAAPAPAAPYVAVAQPTPASAPTPAPTPAAEPQPRPKAKIISLGDVQIKYDGDSVFQKQWVRLSPKEESSIRVINDSNNKLVPMKGRHFEVKRWVKIEGGSVLDETAEEL